MEQILGMITTYGLETVVIALLVNLLTGLVKMPIDEEWRKNLQVKNVLYYLNSNVLSKE